MFRLALAGLIWLKEGDSIVGSSSDSTAVFDVKTFVDTKIGVITVTGDKITFKVDKNMNGLKIDGKAMTVANGVIELSWDDSNPTKVTYA